MCLHTPTTHTMQHHTHTHMLAHALKNACVKKVTEETVIFWHMKQTTTACRLLLTRYIKMMLAVCGVLRTQIFITNRALSFTRSTSKSSRSHHSSEAFFYFSPPLSPASSLWLLGTPSGEGSSHHMSLNTHPNSCLFSVPHTKLPLPFLKT